MLKRVLLTILTAAALIAAAPTVRADWPMIAANPQRTSWVSEEVNVSETLKWVQPIEAFMQFNASLIAANGLIYAPTSRGMIALDAVDGALVWRYDTQIPIGNSPTVDGTTLYVPGMDRRIHVLNATNGNFMWSFDDAGAGYSANPLVINGVLYAPNRDGYFYAIDTSTHNVVWRYPDYGQPPLEPIIQSPAYDDGVIYFAANDCYGYALDTSDGSLIWRTPERMNSLQFQSYWPVIYQDKVIFVGCDLYRSNLRPGDDSEGFDRLQAAMKEAMFYDLPSDAIRFGDITPGVDPWTHGFNVYDCSKISEYYEINNDGHEYLHKPWRRYFIIINQSNGTEYTMDVDNDGNLEYAPIGYNWTKNGNVCPPIVMPDGLLYLKQFIGKLSPTLISARSQLMGWNFGTEYFSFAGIETASVEPEIYSGGGNIIYRNLCCDRSGEWRNVLGGSGNPWYQGVGSLGQQCPGYDVMWHFKAGESNLAGQYGTVNGTYHNHGDQKQTIPYNGRLYSHNSNAILCYAPEGAYSHNNPATSMPLIPMDDERVDDVPVPEVSDIRSLLEREIQLMVDAGNLNPGYYVMGQTVARLRNLGTYFENPGDTLHILSRAHPHLAHNPTLQGQLEAYLQDQYNMYFAGTMYGKKGWSEGAHRDEITFPPPLLADMATINRSTSTSGWGQWSYPQMNFYGMWKYAQVFPGEAVGVYNKAKSKMQVTPPSFSQDAIWEHNAWIMGYVGFLNLQSLAGMESDTVGGRTRSQIQATLDSMMSSRANNFRKDSTFTWNHDNLFRCLNACRNFMFLCPELGEYLRDQIPTQMETAMKEYNWTEPYWFLSRYTADKQESVMAVLYNYHALFQAKAYCLDTPYEELIKYLDVPAFGRGDLYYVDNLITALETPRSSPVISPLGGGTYVEPVTVEIMPAVLGEDVYYTTDGSEPDQGSAVYTAPFQLASSATVKAISFPDGNPTLTATAVFIIDPGLSNQPPDVDAGPDRTIQMPENTVTLAGSYTDATLTFPPTAITTQWSMVSSPGAVSFGNAASVVTTAAFDHTGTYILRLTAYEGLLSNSDDVTIILEPKPNEAPEVDAGADQEIVWPQNSVSLDGTVTDDDLPDPPAQVTINWTAQNGPAYVTFADSSAPDTTVTFDGAGTYVLQLNADDGEHDANDTMTITVHPPVTAEIVAHLKLDDGAGIVATDSSDYANDGQLSGPAWTAGKDGGALSFDGVDDKVTIDNSFRFDSSKGTWSLWVKTDGNWGSDGGSGGAERGSTSVINRHNESASYWGTHIFIQASGIVKVQAKSDTNVGTATSAATVTDDIWHHIAVAFDQASGGRIQIYIDGSPDGSVTTTADWSFAGQDIQLGDSPDYYWEEFAGQIDDVQIYNIALSDVDIAMLYNNGGHVKKAGDINSSNTVDEADLGLMAGQWLQTPGTPSADICPPPSGDGAVDMLDFAVLANDWLD